MRNSVITLIACLAALSAKAQIGYNYRKFDIGLGLSYNQVFPDYPKTERDFGYLANITYNHTPFVNFIGEFHKSKATAGGAELSPGIFYGFTNNYYSGALRAQVQAGEIMDYSRSQIKNFMKNIYLSAGVGVLHSDLNIYENGAQFLTRQTHHYFIPAKVGYEAKIFNNYNEPVVKLDIGYQFNYMLTDQFDGLSTIDSKANDSVGQIVIGIKLSLGGTTSYRKSINY